MSVEAIAKMEPKMETLKSGVKAITETYKEKMFTLQTAYLRQIAAKGHASGRVSEGKARRNHRGS